MTITIIDNESGEAWEKSGYAVPRNGDKWLDEQGFLGTVTADYVSGRYVILKPIPNEYVRRSEVDELAAVLRRARFLTGSVSPSDRAAFESGFGGVAIYKLNEDIDAALEPFTPPKPEERWRWKGDSIFDGDKEFNIANVEGCTELVAALNELDAGANT